MDKQRWPIQFMDPIARQIRHFQLELDIESGKIYFHCQLPFSWKNNAASAAAKNFLLQIKMAPQQKTQAKIGQKHPLDEEPKQRERKILLVEEQILMAFFDDIVPGEIYKIELVVRQNFPGNDDILAILENKTEMFKRMWKIDVKAIFSQNELARLHRKAIVHAEELNRQTKMQELEFLHRTQIGENWSQIFLQPGGPLMRASAKDEGGHAASPINGGEIKGIYFSAMLKPDGQLHSKSPYGNKRLLIRPQLLLDPQKVNLYFADFYCYRNPEWTNHRVTLIAIPKEFPENDFWSRKLIPVNVYDNPFLRLRNHLNEENCRLEWFWEASASNGLWVEVIFAGNLTLDQRTLPHHFDAVECSSESLGAKKGGLRADVHCPICNIYPIPKAQLPQMSAEKQKNQRTARNVPNNEFEWEAEDSGGGLPEIERQKMPSQKFENNEGKKHSRGNILNLNPAIWTNS